MANFGAGKFLNISDAGIWDVLVRECAADLNLNTSDGECEFILRVAMLTGTPVPQNSVVAKYIEKRCASGDLLDAKGINASLVTVNIAPIVASNGKDWGYDRISVADTDLNTVKHFVPREHLSLLRSQLVNIPRQDAIETKKAQLNNISNKLRDLLREIATTSPDIIPQTERRLARIQRIMNSIRRKNRWAWNQPEMGYFLRYNFDRQSASAHYEIMDSLLSWNNEITDTIAKLREAAPKLPAPGTKALGECFRAVARKHDIDTLAREYDLFRHDMKIYNRLRAITTILNKLRMQSSRLDVPAPIYDTMATDIAYGYALNAETLAPMFPGYDIRDLLQRYRTKTYCGEPYISKYELANFVIAHNLPQDALLPAQDIWNISDDMMDKIASQLASETAKIQSERTAMSILLTQIQKNQTRTA